MFSADGIRSAIGAIRGVTSVEVETVKPGVARIRVVGGNPKIVRIAVDVIRPVAVMVIIEHKANAEATPTEMFL